MTREEWENELKGRPCYGGMDLALMWDLAAYALLFPRGRTKDNRRLMEYRLKTFAFIPEGFNPTIGGSLDLSSLTTIPEGFNPTVGGYLDLSSLTPI